MPTKGFSIAPAVPPPKASGLKSSESGPKPEGVLNATAPEGLHTLRTAARVQLLRQRGTHARADEEGRMRRG